ncbi:MAG TPA: ParB N-terminal domain-containing protein [Streptosporangiaceae bacterium]|nr:ParB N-terminal domain-containing protein [Streptosporangiaceae bacterium]
MDTSEPPVTYVATRDVPVGQLTPFPGNARRGKTDKIRESIRRNGQYRSLVVRQCDDGLVILAGNHTYEALRAEGHATVRCEVIECDDHTARRINLADNRLSDLATDDADALAGLLSYLDEDYEGTGWTDLDVHRLIEPGLPEGFQEYDETAAEPAGPRLVVCPNCRTEFDPRESVQ